MEGDESSQLVIVQEAAVGLTGFIDNASAFGINDAKETKNATTSAAAAQNENKIKCGRPMKQPFALNQEQNIGQILATSSSPKQM